MANYQSMYALLCKAIDKALHDLSGIPQAAEAAERLQAALLEAEELYIQTDQTPSETEAD